MENSYVEHPCIFQWTISNPFLPWESMEATFYSSARTVTQWKVTIQPIGRRINNWIFSFSLKAAEFDDELDIIQTLRMQIDITINGRRVASESVSNYFFDSSNHHTYYFETHAVMRPSLQNPLLIIKVEIYLPGELPRINASGISLHQEDQMQLSEDLNRLQNHNRYSNMMLSPNDGFRPTHVHSCILDARWNNFFQIHSDDDFEVQVNISAPLLSDILTYMYSGRLAITWPDWRRGSNMGELFEVIDRYKLYNLYKVFVKSDSQQLRETGKDLVICGINLELSNTTDVSVRWEVDEHIDYLLILHMAISVDGDEVKLSYHLESAVDRRIYIQVNLQFVKRISRPNRPTRRRVLSVHERDYNVDAFGAVGSGEVRFQLDDGIFDDFKSGENLAGRGIEHFLTCLLYLSDGTSLMRVENTLDNTLQNERERFSVLGDAMYALLLQGTEADLRIRCLNESNFHDVYYVHKAVFATRVPKYWRVLQNVPRQGDIPDRVTCSLRSEAFLYVIIYIYTGKIPCFPLPFIDEVYSFAQRSGFEALLNLVNRMRGR